MTKNFPLLWKIYDHIKDPNAKDWHQDFWVTPPGQLSETPTADMLPEVKIPLNWLRSRVYVINPDLCGTAFCVAGHALNMTRNGVFLVYSDGITEHFFDFDTGEVLNVPEEAERTLGLSVDEAIMLFSPDNGLQRIHDLIMDWEEEESV